MLHLVCKKRAQNAFEYRPVRSSMSGLVRGVNKFGPGQKLGDGSKDS